MKKTYRLTYGDSLAEIDVEVDYDVVNENDVLNQINNFWSDAQARLDDADHTDWPVLHAVLRMLCVRLLESGIIFNDAVGHFNRGNVEGWPPLDGSAGIKVLHMCDFEFEPEDVGILEIPNAG